MVLSQKSLGQRYRRHLIPVTLGTAGDVTPDEMWIATGLDQGIYEGQVEGFTTGSAEYHGGFGAGICFWSDLELLDLKKQDCGNVEILSDIEGEYESDPD